MPSVLHGFSTPFFATRKVKWSRFLSVGVTAGADRGELLSNASDSFSRQFPFDSAHSYLLDLESRPWNTLALLTR